MSVFRERAAALGILAGTVGGVAVVTMGLTALMIPAAATAPATPTPVATFDLDTAPTAIGGSLEVTGDRAGTLTLDEARGTGGRYDVLEGGGVAIRPAQAVELRGPDGRVRFDPDDGSVMQIDFDGLSFYLDPEECTVTLGAAHPDNGLMAALVECPEIADVRDSGLVSVSGIVALPVEVLRGRGGLPETGGTLQVGGTSVTLDEAEIFLDQEPDDDGRIRWGTFTEDGGMAVEYDPDAEQLYLTQISAGDIYAVASEPCPILSQELGRISESVTVVRLEMSCSDMTDAAGDEVTVAGTVVADVVQGFTVVEGSQP